MDYFETFFTLIDIMAEAYYKLLVGTEGPICTQAYFELVLKCDGKFKVGGSVSKCVCVQWPTCMSARKS